MGQNWWSEMTIKTTRGSANAARGTDCYRSTGRNKGAGILVGGGPGLVGLTLLSPAVCLKSDLSSGWSGIAAVPSGRGVVQSAEGQVAA